MCGVFEETIQMIVTGRTAIIRDLLADMAGAIFAILLIKLVANKM
jgi:VanZ family protein